MEEFKTYPELKGKLIERGKKIGLTLDLENPVTIQDKINWMKLYDSTPLKTRCADKIQVHDYCKEKLGVDLCIPILHVYNRVEDIKWNELPKQFVIKCNHGSGMNIIVRDKGKLNIQEVSSKLKKFMQDDFAYHVGYEMHYHDIPHRIFVEEYKEDDNQKSSLFDYKFWCFNGEPKFMTITDGFGHGDMSFYDMNFQKTNISRNDFKEPKTPFKKPENFDKMIEYSKKLSEDFLFVRVDFYEVGGKLYLGELTFTPGAGFMKFKDKNQDKMIGDMLSLGDRAKINNLKKNKTLNIISHNCVGARIYQQKNEKYSNPFMWCVIPPNDFLYLYENFEKINFQNFKLEKDKEGYKIVIDNSVNVYYPHYKYSSFEKTPVKKAKDGIDVYYNKINEYIVEKYRTRLARMCGKPLFIVTDRDFIVNKQFNFKRSDLLKYIDKEDCLVVTADKTLSGSNVIYMSSTKLDPKDISKIILKSRKDL